MAKRHSRVATTPNKQPGSTREATRTSGAQSRTKRILTPVPYEIDPRSSGRASEIIAAAHTVLPHIRALVSEVDPSGEERLGGYLCALLRVTVGNHLACGLKMVNVGKLIHVPIGVLNLLKVSKYHSFSFEKTQRTFQMHRRRKQVSSWQSRNPDKGKWGGGIITARYIMAFSGLPEAADEALILVVAIMIGELTYEQALKIAEISDNEYFTRLFTRMQKAA